MKNRIHQKAFTLIETAIVLTIIGLLIGGIMVGRTLIRSAQIQAVLVDVTKYKAALDRFIKKYNYPPGDLPTATSYWGAAHATPATCWDTQGTGTQTCNGDGNWQINWNAGYPTSSGSREDLRAWQQLQNAGLITGNFTGTPAGLTGAYNTCGYCTVPGTNVPAASVGGGGYSVAWLGTTSGHAQWYDASYRNVIFLGRKVGSDAYTAYPLLTTDEAYLIDNKTDDGKPASGIIYAWKSSVNPNCTTSDTASAAYNTSVVSRNLCSLVIETGF